MSISRQFGVNYWQALPNLRLLVSFLRNYSELFVIHHKGNRKHGFSNMALKVAKDCMNPAC